MNDYDFIPPKKQAEPPTYYQSYKWFVPTVGWVLREEWFTWDGHNARLTNFREQLIYDV